MRAHFWGVLAAGAVGVMTGCGGSPSDLEETTDTTASAQKAPPYTTGSNQSTQSTTPPATTATAVPIQYTLPAGLITFDDVASGTTIDTHYPGVTFTTVSDPGQPDVFARQDFDLLPAVTCTASNVAACPPSGNDVTLISVPTVTADFPGQLGAVQATFASPKSWVAIMARPHLYGEPKADLPVTNAPFLEALDSAGNYIEVKYTIAYGSTSGPAWGTWQTLTLTAPPGTTISSVIFATQAWQTSNAVSAEFDNLSYWPL